MRPAISTEKLTDTLTLCERHRDSEGPHTQDTSWWLYDETIGWAIVVRALTRELALIKAITYYQKRLSEVESAHKVLTGQVDAFVSQFVEEDEEERKDWNV